jgi:hypothetical protein
LALLLPFISSEGPQTMRLAPAKGGCEAQEAGEEVATMKPLSMMQWYRVLRAHHHWTVFQSIRYALWLMS